jgi:hypothetical protein
MSGEPTKLGITSPEEGAQAFLREFLLGQRATMHSLGLESLGYKPGEAAMTRPALQVIQSESSTTDVPTAFDQLPNLGANGLETPGFNGGFYFRRGTTHNHGFTG